MINGIDISSVQSNVDFKAVAASGVKFVIFKCGNGNDGSDPNYSRSLAAAQAVGLLCATYHFVYPLPPDTTHPTRDPVLQAEMHYKACKTDVVAIDIEWPEVQDFAKWGCGPKQINDWCLRYLKRYTELSGKKPIIYTYPYFAKAINFSQEFAEYPLWIASYGKDKPDIPNPWNNYVIWQTTGGGGKLPNGAPVDTDVVKDLSLWNKDVSSDLNILDAPTNINTQPISQINIIPPTNPSNGSKIAGAIINLAKTIFHIR